MTISFQEYDTKGITRPTCVCYLIYKLRRVKGAAIFLIQEYKEKKEEIWLSPMTKAPTPTEMSKGQNDNTNVTKKFDYRAVADRLRTVSWSNYGHPTGVVNLVYGPNLPTPKIYKRLRRWQYDPGGHRIDDTCCAWFLLQPRIDRPRVVAL